MSISGPNLESWSTIISCTICKDEFDKKLSDFHEQLHFKRSTIGFICGPRYVPNVNENMYANSNDIFQAIKKFFPNIPFMGVYNYGYHSHFGVNSLSSGNLNKY